MNVLPARRQDLGDGMLVTRALPNAARRTVGPWCFADVFGPIAVTGPERDVRPHPHVGLATVTWLLSGGILHRDTLGSAQPIAPGQLNWMSSGRGIAHSEHFLPGAPLRGVQLWLALPDPHRGSAPWFRHEPSVPQARVGGLSAAVWTGTLAGVEGAVSSPHPAVGAELRLDGAAELPLTPGFEHALLWLEGEARLGGEVLPTDVLVALPAGGDPLRLEGRGVGVLLGGAPFEPLLLWWNFAARTRDEVVAAREAWEGGAFGEVPGASGRIPAPDVPPGLVGSQR